MATPLLTLTTYPNPNTRIQLHKLRRLRHNLSKQQMAEADIIQDEFLRCGWTDYDDEFNYNCLSLEGDEGVVLYGVGWDYLGGEGCYWEEVWEAEEVSDLFSRLISVIEIAMQQHSYLPFSRT